MNAKEFILGIAKNQLGKSIEPGHNGPYFDPETLVRNTAHWLIIYARCFEWTRDNEFKEGLIDMAEELLLKKHFPADASFYHREKEGKDKCNGLVGQAWSIEALVKATEITNESKYKELAKKVFHNHTFNSEFGLWHILEVDGRKIELDPTFNHQLWFASAVSHFYKDDEVAKSQVDQFFKKIDENLTILKNGLIFHPIDRSLDILGGGFKNAISNVLKRIYIHPAQIKRRFKPNEFTRKLVDKSIGYHTFNLFAFEVIKRNAPELSFFNTKGYQKILDYVLNPDLRKLLDGNKYAYPYNAPGFEIPFVISQIDTHDQYLEISTYYFKEQVNQTYNKDQFVFSNNNPDPKTLTARIYELSLTNTEYLERILL